MNKQCSSCGGDCGRTVKHGCQYTYKTYKSIPMHQWGYTTSILRETEKSYMAYTSVHQMRLGTRGKSGRQGNEILHLVESLKTCDDVLFDAFIAIYCES